MLPIRVYVTCPHPLHKVKCLDKQHESKKILLNIFVKRLSSITKKGEIESPSLVLDNWWNLWTNPWAQCVDKRGWSKAKWWSHMMVMVMVVTKTSRSSAPTWKRRKKKTKTRLIKAKVSNRFLFWHSRHHRGWSVFRIDSRTIKKGNLWLSGYRVLLGDMILAYAFRDLVC